MNRVLRTRLEEIQRDINLLASDYEDGDQTEFFRALAEWAYQREEHLGFRNH